MLWRYEFAQLLQDFHKTPQPYDEALASVATYLEKIQALSVHLEVIAPQSNDAEVSDSTLIAPMRAILHKITQAIFDQLDGVGSSIKFTVTSEAEQIQFTVKSARKINWTVMDPIKEDAKQFGIDVSTSGNLLSTTVTISLPKDKLLITPWF